jgi:hypothetical protein
MDRTKIVAWVSALAGEVQGSLTSSARAFVCDNDLIRHEQVEESTFPITPFHSRYRKVAHALILHMLL